MVVRYDREGLVLLAAFDPAGREVQHSELLELGGQAELTVVQLLNQELGYSQPKVTSNTVPHSLTLGLAGCAAANKCCEAVGWSQQGRSGGALSPRRWGLTPHEGQVQ